MPDTTGWISVEERLPPYNGVMVLAVHNNDIPFLGMTKYYQILESRYWVDDSGLERAPTHWKPIPKETI